MPPHRAQREQCPTTATVALVIYMILQLLQLLQLPMWPSCLCGQQQHWCSSVGVATSCVCTARACAVQERLLLKMAEAGNVQEFRRLLDAGVNCNVFEVCVAL